MSRVINEREACCCSSFEIQQIINQEKNVFFSLSTIDSIVIYLLGNQGNRLFFSISIENDFFLLLVFVESIQIFTPFNLFQINIILSLPSL